jgi:hypothetical protein
VLVSLSRPLERLGEMNHKPPIADLSSWPVLPTAGFMGSMRQFATPASSTPPAGSSNLGISARRPLSAYRARAFRVRRVTGRLLPICWVWAASAVLVRADDVDLDSRFFRQLSAPMTSVMDGNPFRAGLTRVAEQAHLNLWLDRNVDPSLPIDAGPLGPTVFGGLEKLAASQKCVILPLANVVLVGRESWVERTAAAILRIPEKRRGAKVDISWDALSTPEEALAVTLGGTRRDLPPLPHDLWPAVHWREVDREVAIQLVLAQFDAPTTPAILSGAAIRVTRRYPQKAISLEKLRDWMQTADATSEIRSSGDWLVAEGNVAAHRIALSQLLGQESGNVTRVDPDRATFSLKKMTTSAENALNQLARAAGRTCVIAPDAGEACRSMVSLEGQDTTLRELVDLVASQAGVMAVWEDETLRIQLPAN